MLNFTFNEISKETHSRRIVFLWIRFTQKSIIWHLVMKKRFEFYALTISNLIRDEIKKNFSIQFHSAKTPSFLPKTFASQAND